MPAPGVTINELDNQLGVITAVGGKLLAIVGPASAGPLNTPSVFTRGKDIASTFGSGALVEAAAYHTEKYRLPVVCVRSAASVAPVLGTLTSTATGTSVVAKDDDTPVDDYDLAVEILTGGTVGVAGITYRLTYDGGRNWSPRMSLGTDDFIAWPGAGVSVELGDGTMVTGDTHAVKATGPQWNSTDLLAALEPLSVTQLQWEHVLFVGGVIDDNTFDTADAVRTYRNGKHIWTGAPRMPNVGETEAAYRTALEPLRAAKASGSGSVYAGACDLVSAVSGRTYVRPFAWPVASRQASVSEEINISLEALGPLPGVSIRDANGAPRHHDEAIYPGLDDLGYGTATTKPRKPGVYVTLPRTFAVAGSDFEIVPNRRVINLVYELMQDYLSEILHRPILVSRKTGFILPTEATAIEKAADAILFAGVLAKPKASGAYFKLSRTDTLLSLPKLTCSAKVQPLAYPRWIELDLSFENPALSIQAV
jgi:hypothetical protein